MAQNFKQWSDCCREFGSRVAMPPQEAADVSWSLWVSAAQPETDANAHVKLDRPGKAFELTTNIISSLVKVAQPEDCHKADALAWLVR